MSHTKLKELLGVSHITQAYQVLVAVDKSKSGVILRRPRATGREKFVPSTQTPPG